MLVKMKGGCSSRRPPMLLYLALRPAMVKRLSTDGEEEGSRS